MSNYLFSFFKMTAIVIFNNFFITPLNIVPNRDIIIVLIRHIYLLDFQRTIVLDCHNQNCPICLTFNFSNNSADYHNHDYFDSITDINLGNCFHILVANVGYMIISNWEKYDFAFYELINQNPTPPFIKEDSSKHFGIVVIVIWRTY